MILLSEDDSVLRRLFLSNLRRLGYDAEAAETVQEAIEIASNNPGLVSLHVADINMPGMDGRDLHKHIAKSSPNAKCLLMSGHPLEHLENESGIPEWADFIQKPFKFEDFANKIRNILGG